MNTKKVLSVVAVVVVLGGVWLLVRNQKADYQAVTTFEECAALYPVMESYPEQCNTPDGKHFVRDISNDLNNLIQVSYPQPNMAVASPLTVTGQARGTFYFEASFPVKLLDANGVVLAQVPAQAQSEWMTTEFVPFKATFNFKVPATKSGTLVLQNDNPSGDPSKSKELRIQVSFTTGAPAKYGQEVTLVVGDTIIFEDGLMVMLKSIADSRCKPGVQCIWAGELAATLSFDEQVSDPRYPLQTKEIILGTVNNKNIGANGYNIALQSATATTATIIVRSETTEAGSEGGSLTGYVHVGPVCPVERIPPDPNCADRPFATANVEIRSSLTGKLVRTATTDAKGKFTTPIGIGSYLVKVLTPNGAALPRCSEQPVTIAKKQVTILDISCDSGIR